MTLRIATCLVVPVVLASCTGALDEQDSGRGSGGSVNTAGSNSGGTNATGGFMSTGGVTSSGGVTSTGGSFGTGGVAGTAGTSSAGGSSGGGGGCLPAYLDCGGVCVDASADPANCGSCGNACGSGQLCQNGSCVCAAGLTACASGCLDTNGDTNNCGACGVVCPQGQVCSGGQCTNNCAPGETNCNGCVNLNTSLQNCGSCGNACSAGLVCTNGDCVCSGGLSQCGQQCVNTANDNANCGACGNACSGGRSCSSASCVCPQGQTFCNGQCTNTGSDMANCGSCGNACSAGQTCSNGTCMGGTGCGVSPVNPNATQQAKNLLCYLYSQYNNHVLSGQQETSWSNPASDISWYASNGMKYPAILGGDYLYPQGTSDRAIAYWQAGGITMIRYHMGAPPNSDTYENSQGSANINNVLTQGTNENNSFRSKLDYVAAELQKLENANVPVLWAPFHEAQQNGWFWWSKGTGAQYVELWKYMYNYLTNTKGLNNILWLMPFSGSPNSAFYPGKQYVDIAGPDTYDTNQPFTSIFNAARTVIGNTVPIALHETGRIPNPSNMFPSSAPWVLFSVWASYQKDGTHNTTSNIQSVYANSYTVTRDEIPNLK